MIRDVAGRLARLIGHEGTTRVPSRSEEKYRLLFENLNDAAFLADAETGTILEANKEAERLLGRSREEIVGMHQAELHPPGQGEKYRRKFERHVASGHGADHDGEIVRNDGTVVPVFISASTMTIGGRGVILGLFRDISDQKRVEEKLRYRAEFERLVSGISTKFINIDLTEIDPAIRTALEDIGRFTGADRSYLFLFSEVGGEVTKMHEWCDGGTTPRSWGGQGGAQDPGLREIEASVVVPVGPGEHPIGFLGLDSAKEGRGWTEDTIPLLRMLGEVFVSALGRARAQEALKEAHRQTEQLLTAIPSILIAVDTTGTIRGCNEAAERTFGIKAQDAVGGHLARCGIQWDWVNVLGQVEQWLADGGPTQLPLDDVRFTRPNGKEGLLGLTVNTVVNERGERDGFLVFAADVTERRELESQLFQAQKLESIGQLAAGIAHEINTPTQYVGDNIRFLKDSFNDLLELLGKGGRLLEAAKRGNVDPDLVAEIETAAARADVEYLAEEIPKAIEQSLEGVDRVASIIRAMKEFSHPGGKEKTAVDINRAIQNTVTVARNEWKYVAEMDMDFDESLPPVPCLPGEFNQVILNMVINATHAIADVVGDGSNGKGRIAIATRRDDGWAEVRISDTGSGIPEAIRDRIFDPFFTTKEVGKGTGQGLSIARFVIVDKHGGTITFESEVGKGTTFIVRLPLQDTRTN